MTGLIAANKRMRDAADQQWQRKAVDCVTVDLPFPISVNQLYRRLPRSVVRTARYARWRREAEQMIAMQRPGRVEGKFTASLVVQNRTKNRPDADNLSKGCLDALQAAGVISNDNKAEHVEVKWSDEISGCRVTVRRAE